MSRRSLVLFTLLLAACGDDTGIRPEPTPLPSRVEAVGARREDPAQRFCDVSAPFGEGAPIALPATEGPALPTEGWRWINVWATWCAPCVEEIPRLLTFRDRLQSEGIAVTHWLVSVDATSALVDEFRARHAGTPESARLTDPAGLPALVSALGVDAGATIPIHALVDPTGHVRCVRTGAITDRDFDVVRAIVRQTER